MLANGYGTEVTLGQVTLKYYQSSKVVMLPRTISNTEHSAKVAKNCQSFFQYLNSS